MMSGAPKRKTDDQAGYDQVNKKNEIYNRGEAYATANSVNFTRIDAPTSDKKISTFDNNTDQYGNPLITPGNTASLSGLGGFNILPTGWYMKNQDLEEEDNPFYKRYKKFFNADPKPILKYNADTGEVSASIGVPGGYLGAFFNFKPEWQTNKEWAKMHSDCIDLLLSNGHTTVKIGWKRQEEWEKAHPGEWGVDLGYIEKVMKITAKKGGLIEFDDVVMNHLNHHCSQDRKLEIFEKQRKYNDANIKNHPQEGVMDGLKANNDAKKLRDEEKVLEKNEKEQKQKEKELEVLEKKHQAFPEGDAKKVETEIEMGKLKKDIDNLKDDSNTFKEFELLNKVKEIIKTKEMDVITSEMDKLKNELAAELNKQVEVLDKNIAEIIISEKDIQKELDELKDKELPDDIKKNREDKLAEDLENTKAQHEDHKKERKDISQLLADLKEAERNSTPLKKESLELLEKVGPKKAKEINASITKREAELNAVKEKITAIDEKIEKATNVVLGKDWSTLQAPEKMAAIIKESQSTLDRSTSVDAILNEQVEKVTNYRDRILSADTKEGLEKVNKLVNGGTLDNNKSRQELMTAAAKTIEDLKIREVVLKNVLTKSPASQDEKNRIIAQQKEVRENINKAEKKLAELKKLIHGYTPDPKNPDAGQKMEPISKLLSDKFALNLPTEKEQKKSARQP